MLEGGSFGDPSWSIKKKESKRKTGIPWNKPA